MVDASGQSLAYFYARENDNDAGTAGVLTMDEARRLASNFRQAANVTRSRIAKQFQARSPTACQSRAPPASGG